MLQVLRGHPREEIIDLPGVRGTELSNQRTTGRGEPHTRHAPVRGIRSTLDELIPFGAVSKVDVVWAWGDLMNALQVFPNMIGLLGLSGVVAAALAARTAPSPPRATRT